MTGILITDIDFRIKVSCICFEFLSLEFLVMSLANESSYTKREGGREEGREGEREGKGEEGGCSLV